MASGDCQVNGKAILFFSISSTVYADMLTMATVLKEILHTGDTKSLDLTVPNGKNNPTINPRIVKEKKRKKRGAVCLTGTPLRRPRRNYDLFAK